MTYTNLREGSDAAFHWRTGVNWSTFYLMIDALKSTQADIKQCARPQKLLVEDQLLLYLTFWQKHQTLSELRTYYGISALSALGMIDRVGEQLIRSGHVHLAKHL